MSHRFYEDVLWRKQNTMVDFPLCGLDMRHFLAKLEQKHTTYDLYAVSNHYGTMDGGHYTTYSRSSLNRK
jgi:ubiquitin C-terminal hydrolase